MDVLSDVVAAMRVGRPHSSRTLKRAPWGVRFQPFPGAGFHVVLQGACWLMSSSGDPIALSVGDVVFMAQGRGHALSDALSTPLIDVPSASLVEPSASPAGVPPADSPWFDGPASSTLLLCGGYLLDQARPHPLLRELPEVIHLPARVGRHPSLRAALDLLGAELEQRQPGVDAVLPALLDVLVLYILRAWFDEQAEHHTAVGWAAALRDPAVSTALSDIHREPARQWTVQALATRAGLSRAAFARRFTELVGKPPLAYLTWWRMTIAARLLRESDATLSAIAGRIGYTSEFAFAKAFKREFGISPGARR